MGGSVSGDLPGEWSAAGTTRFMLLSIRSILQSLAPFVVATPPARPGLASFAVKPKRPIISAAPPVGAQMTRARAPTSGPVQ